MNGNIERFIESIESSNSKKVAKYALKNVDDNIENYNIMQRLCVLCVKINIYHNIHHHSLNGAFSGQKQVLA